LTWIKSPTLARRCAGPIHLVRQRCVKGLKWLPELDSNQRPSD
jgi:hypothetical protein